MKTISQEFKGPIEEIERTWLRKSVVIFFTPIVFLIGFFIILFENIMYFIESLVAGFDLMWTEFTVKNWVGEKNEWEKF